MACFFWIASFKFNSVQLAQDSLNMADDYFIYTCVSTALTGVFIKPLFIIWIIFLCLAPRRKDHARVGVTYLKAVMPFEVA